MDLWTETTLCLKGALFPQDSTSDMDSARTLVSDLGKEALAEHGDWLMLHRERPIELPKAEI